MQGFYDHHTDIAGANPEEVFKRMPQWKQASGSARAALERKVRRWCEASPDGPRYKAIGNSFAVPVVRWIGERVQEVDALLSSEGDADGRGDR